MTERLPASPSPRLLEEFAKGFDDLLAKRSQREGFRRYLEGLLLPMERNKTLTGIVNSEPIVGAQHAQAQKLQWFLSESNWGVEAINTRRVAMLQAEPETTANAEGVLIVDETGDRKWGHKTAHVGRQYLSSLGKVDNGVVSVESMWANEQLYYPIVFAPYTPSHWFAKGKQDPEFRTKPQIAVTLVKEAISRAIPFRAVVADSFYGENDTFMSELDNLKVGYVLALKPSHAWWHLEGHPGSLREIAESASWSTQDPGDWQAVIRSFRDGHQETWWALEIEGGPYGIEKVERAVVVTTHPERLPPDTTWYLLTNLPAPDTIRARQSALPPAELREVTRLYGLRVWVEQTYKQVKQHLGWAQYQVRSDLAIRRHWQLVCCAFTFCWWVLLQDALVPDPAQQPQTAVDGPTSTNLPEKKSCAGITHRLTSPHVANGPPLRPRLARTLHHAPSILVRLVYQTTTSPATSPS